MAKTAHCGNRTLLWISAGLLVFALAGSQARADFYLHAWEDRQEGAKSWKLHSDLRYLSTTANYDLNGTALAPVGLENYTRVQLDIGVQYGLTERVTLFGRASWAYINLGTTSLSATAFGFSDQTIGANARLVKTRGGISVDAQVQMDFAVYSNASAALNNTPYLGDGSLDITTGGFVNLPIESESGYRGFNLTGGLGYTFRSEGYSAAVPWSVIGSYTPRGEGVVVSLGFLGLQSLKNDERTFNTVLSGTAGGGTGGSFMSGAINPSLLSIRGQVGFQSASELSFLVSAEQTLAGTNAPRAFTVGGGIVLRPGSDAQPAAESPELVPQNASRAGDLPRGFQSYSLDARVVRMNDRLNAVRIDKGHDAGVSKGEHFDIFKAKPDGTTGDVVARAVVTAVGENQADLRISEYFKEVWIEEGFHAKRVVK